MTRTTKTTIIFLALLCVESAMLDALFNMQQRDDAGAAQWHTVMIKQIDALKDGK